MTISRRFSSRSRGILRALALVLTSVGLCAVPAAADLSDAEKAALRVKPLPQLKTQADELLAKRDFVLIRRDVDVLLVLIDRLLEEGDKAGAEKYLDAALQHYPWALDYQIQYAALLDEKGKSEQAKAKAKLVLDHAESDRLINQARKLLGQDPLPALPKLAKLQGDGPALVLVPVGPVETWLLLALEEDLGGALGIPVFSRSVEIPLPPESRSGFSRYIEETRRRLLQHLDEPEFESILEKLDLDREQIEKHDDAVLRFLRTMAASSAGGPEPEAFDAMVEDLRGRYRQWDIEKLNAAMKKAVTPHARPQVKFLGVAAVDAFMGGSNFIFGMAENGGRWGVITYHRFTAAFNGETPDRKRLEERALKQSLSSIGFMFGVKRCSDPTCARAYPHNLAEHDAKSTELCPACRQALNRALDGQGSSSTP
jgi:predicted Zn-dependent protease